MLIRKHSIVWVVTVAVALLFASPTHVLAITWTGSVSDAFFNNGNWDGPVSTAVAGQDLRFDNPALVPHQPNLGGSSHPRVNHLTFEHAGWTIANGGGFSLNVENRGVDSYGAGINILNGSLSFLRASHVFDIGPGNTFAVTGNTWSQGNQDMLLSGGGTLVIATNTATGSDFNANTTISDATLLVNVEKPGARYTVNDGGVLGGNGTIIGRANRNVTINDGGVLAPGGNGTFGDIIGTFSSRGSNTDHQIILNSGATLAIDFNSDAADLLYLINGTSPDNASRLFMNAGSILALNGLADAGTTHTIVQTEDELIAGKINGQFTNVLLNGVLVDPNTDPALDLIYTANDITVVFHQAVIPEPASLALVGLGGLMLLGRRRK